MRRYSRIDHLSPGQLSRLEKEGVSGFPTCSSSSWPADYRPVLVIVSREGLEEAGMARTLASIASEMSAGNVGVAVHRVPPSLAHGLAPAAQQKQMLAID